MPASTDRFDGENCYIITNPSRGNFHLYGNDPEEIRIEDIAQALSNQCRFTGHMAGDHWYSVAEHCVDVANLVGILGGSPYEQFCGLLHDSPEFGLADIAAPFKREIGSYYEKENLIWQRIAKKFNVSPELPSIVKKADWLALFIEARYLVVPGHEYIVEKWVGWDPHGIEAFKMDYRPLEVDHLQARKMFLHKFHLLRQHLAAV